MKQSFFTCALVLLVTMLSAQNKSSDEMVIKKVIQQQEDAWNKHDWEMLSSYFTDDGTLINFVGQFWKGRNEILAHFKLFSTCCLEATSLKFDVRNIRFFTPDIAIVYTEETLFVVSTSLLFVPEGFTVRKYAAESLSKFHTSES